MRWTSTVQSAYLYGEWQRVRVHWVDATRTRAERCVSPLQREEASVVQFFRACSVRAQWTQARALLAARLNGRSGGAARALPARSLCSCTDWPTQRTQGGTPLCSPAIESWKTIRLSNFLGRKGHSKSRPNLGSTVDLRPGIYCGAEKGICASPQKSIIDFNKLLFWGGKGCEL